ncbi:hypothetical protein Dcar01_03588 [Deinococcus carri]|uniref:HEAT repeat domain-containing protein n=1 Tax=Deinococcus carri TaxID=1211323 RepID=A0ABP9WBX4_9DEIO
MQPLLRSALQHPEWFVRQEALELIGFHYDLSDDPALLNQVRVMLLLDPGGDGAVRLAAASVLGVQSCAWDASLICAMTDDPDEDVRQVAFRALLHLLKLGFNVEERLLAEVSCAGRPLTLATLQEFSARFDS